MSEQTRRVALFAAAIVSLLIAVGYSLSFAAVEIGGDEGCEVAKGFLWANGYNLYSTVWNNQPPLYTVLLGICFKLFGPSIVIARIVALSSAALLIAGLFSVVKHRCGFWAAYIAGVCLVAAPVVLKLCVSVMLEVPAMAAAIWAFWALQQWNDDRRFRWLLLSCALYAIALQVKLTAAVMLPALEGYLLVETIWSSPRPMIKKPLSNIAVWNLGALAIFLTLGILLGGSYDQMWASLFSKGLAHATEHLEVYRFSTGILLNHKEGLLGAGVGLLLMLARREWRKLLFPSILLLTVFGVHFHRRPWWWYYYLHMAIPLAWFSGYGLAELKRSITTIKRSAMRYRAVLIGLQGLAATLIAGTLLLSGGRRLIGEIDSIGNIPRAADIPVIEKMRRYASKTQWIYTRHSIYAFHARILLIPELAVLPLNRFWSERITWSEVWSIVRRLKPEQLLLDEKLDPEMQIFVESNYRLEYAEGSLQLYVSKAIPVKTD